MSVNVKYQNFELIISEENVECDKVINENDLNEVMRYLKAQIRILKQYRCGVSMGKRNILEYIDDNGFYSNYAAGSFLDDGSDI